MNPKLRLALSLLGGGGLVFLLFFAATALPSENAPLHAYANDINGGSVPQRHATDYVSAVNFDYRSLDTLGEEFILFTAALGTAMVVRSRRPAQVAPSEKEVRHHRSPTRAWGWIWGGASVVMGIYLATHGQISPGGGFQGGVTIVSGLLFLLIAGSTFWEHERTTTLSEYLEAMGVGGFVAVGLAALCLGLAFLGNFLPLGIPGTVDSSGTIALISCLVGAGVAGSLMLILSEFLRHTEPA